MNCDNSAETVKVAGLVRRAAARAVDTLFMLVAYALTLVAVGVLLTLGVLINVAREVDPYWGASTGDFVVLYLALWLPLALMAVYRYEAVSTARCGQTFGKRLTYICVVRYRDGAGIVTELPDLNSIRLRWAISHAAVSAAAVMLAVWVYVVNEVELIEREGWLMLLGLWSFAAVAWAACYVSALCNRERRGWHDKAAGTIVVRATDEILERLAESSGDGTDDFAGGAGTDTLHGGTDTDTCIRGETTAACAGVGDTRGHHRPQPTSSGSVRPDSKSVHDSGSSWGMVSDYYGPRRSAGGEERTSGAGS